MLSKRVGKNILVYISKRSMLNLLYGNIRRDELNFKSQKLLLPHGIAEKKEILKNFAPSKLVHGATLVKIPNTNILAMAFHTSREETFMHGLDTRNIAIDEDYNPIKYSNTVQYMFVEDFIKYYKFDRDPTSVLTSPRYGIIAEHDMLYCCARAFKKSFDSQEKPVIITFEENKEISEMGDFRAREGGEILTPAQAKYEDMSEIGEIDKFHKKLAVDCEIYAEDEEGKKELLKRVKEVQGERVGRMYQGE